MKATRGSLIPCKTCEEIRPADAFYVQVVDGKKYRSKTCRRCQLERSRQGRRRVVERRGGKVGPARKTPDGMTGAERMAFWATHKARAGCADCGMKDWRRLEFDHLPGHEKLFTIGTAVRKTATYSDEEIAAEVAKCDVVCRSCHQRRTVSRARYPESYWPTTEDQELGA